VRLRGTITSVRPGDVSVRLRSGETVQIALPATLVVNEVYPIELAEIKPGSFIGVGAMPQADGTQRAIAVTVFPESARGTGEGHRPFDLTPESTMTNATVATVTAPRPGRPRPASPRRRRRRRHRRRAPPLPRARPSSRRDLRRPLVSRSRSTPTVISVSPTNSSTCSTRATCP